MIAGLLICDHVRPEWQANFGDYPAMFVNLFPEFEWRFYKVQEGQFPDNLNDCDVYFATGSRHSVYDNLPWIDALKAFIKQLYEHKKYFIGVCFGHQVLGAALGGHVKKATQGWCVGVHTFTIKKPKTWMQPTSVQMNLLMMCQDQIVELPPDSEVLASSEQCPIGMIQIGETMLGIQAHPEFSKAYDQQLMEVRRVLMGNSVVDQGLASLEMDVHRATIRSWVLGFLSNI